MNPEFINQLQTLLAEAPEETRHIIQSGEIEASLVGLTLNYHLTVSESISIKNTILLTLLGAIKPKDVKEALRKDLTVSSEDLENILHSIDEGIFERARITLFGKEYEQEHTVRNLSVGEKDGNAELREQILSQTDRNSAIKKSPLETTPATTSTKKSTDSEPGSRSELLEKMNILDTIPNTEEIETRLSRIRAQITEEKQEETKQEEKEIALDLKESHHKMVFPKRYAIDPYREMPD